MISENPNQQKLTLLSQRAVEVVKGIHGNMYTNFSLEGAIDEPLNPRSFIVILPELGQKDFTLATFNLPSKGRESTLMELYHQVVRLGIPDRVRELETQIYGEQQGDELEFEEQIKVGLGAMRMPLAILLFSNTSRDNTSTVHIYHHTNIRPSRALFLMQERVKQRIANFN
ncbi:hypothetical protein HYT02_02215 [Candidatus Gottesmanbacteria bacterium]|nr:hypothetical protein [Candidatus Gottesmanbacteria bacterium]